MTEHIRAPLSRGPPSGNPIPIGAVTVAQIEITSEEEVAGGWSFPAQVLDEHGQVHHCTLHLSWADYNLWSPNGADAPAEVAEAALSVLLTLQSASALKQHVDASLLRRLDPEADKKVPRWIGR